MAKPFLKWAGGKTQLLPQLLARTPARIGTYYEPFLGGGALFFALQREGRFERAVLSDSNAELIGVYEQVRDGVEELLEALAVHQRKYRAASDRADYYYRIRGKRPACGAGAAARLIFLNKTCFNGLYRVNSRGEFNVPHGSYVNPTICDADGLRVASAALQEVELRTVDFAEALGAAQVGDFAYCDPPYVPLNETANFTAYTAANFGAADQRRLAATAAGVCERGVDVLLSNSGHPEVAQLYLDAGFQLETVEAARLINSNGSERGTVREYLIRGKRARLQAEYHGA